MTDGAFPRMLQTAFGNERAEVILNALEEPASTSIRINPLKSKGEPEVSAGHSSPVPWCSLGRILSERPSFTMDPAFHGGAYYVQDSSSMFVGYVFRRILPTFSGTLKVLDLCAAPGGKTTDLAASLREHCGEDFLLVSNEVMSNRCGALADNVARWGDPNVIVTNADPSAFSKLAGFFDIILTDVPCSGEGMFRKDPEAVRQWSEENVELCCARQKRILADVWGALKEGGVLVYSTCTFNVKENDGNTAWAAEELGAETITPECDFPGLIRTVCGYSIAPGFAPGEGQYCSVLRKTGEIGKSGKHDGKRRNGAPKASAGKHPGNILKPCFCFDAEISERNGALIALPGNIAGDVAEVVQAVRTISSGVKCGCLKNGKLVPDEDLMLSAFLKDDPFVTVEVDRQTALAYLHRDTIVLGTDVPKGYVALSWQGIRFGVVNNLGSRCNNLHPVSRRILKRI
ncbi:MAG: rRNA cytosine-C5-methyltransferase [Candidatus Cryptobacteroides sp.]